MTLPIGVITAHVTFGDYLDFTGDPGVGEMIVTPSTDLVWEATGSVLFRKRERVKLVASAGSIDLPATDQPGFTDGQGNAVTNWSYEFNRRLNGQASDRFDVQLPTEGATGVTIDLDALVPVTGTSGDVVLLPAVTSVNGHTGPVALDASDVGAAGLESVNTFTQTQTFDEVAGIKIGDELALTFEQGFAGDRWKLTGQSSDSMPYLEVVPNTKTGTDPGGSVAGIQVYNTLYGGVSTAPEREFVAIEAKGDLYSGGRMFRLGTWASGTGQYLPFRIGIGELNLVDFTSNGSTDGAIELLSKTRIKSLGATIDNMIDFQRGTSFKALRAVVAAATAAQGARVFFGRTRGSIGVPTNLASGDRIGGVEFGSYSTGAAVGDATEVLTAYVRALTRESYSAIGTARGSQIDFGITYVGSTTMADALRIADPATADEVGMFVLVNRAGTKALSRVVVGAADSAGAGFRTLRVAN